MSKVYNKCYYIVATHNGQHYYTEGDFSQNQLDKFVNQFDIDEFINEADEEFTGPEEGHYAVYRQSSVSLEQAIDIGYVKVVGDSYVYRAYATEEAINEYERIEAELQAEVEQEFGDEDYPLICLKQFSKVVA